MKKLSILFAAMLLVLGIAAQSFAAIYAPKVFSENNNLTMLDSTGALLGGTNDVYFNWDGTLKTSVVASGQVSNAVFASATPCPFNGTTWSAHDAAIYGPGTYTVYTNCAAGRPGCGVGTSITFTVNNGEMGLHLLLSYGTSTLIDVVNILAPNQAFGPSPMYTGACGSNSASKVWTWMSRDPGTTGINGVPIVDGGTLGATYANFNVMKSAVDTVNNNFTMVAPNGLLTGGTNDVRITWDGVLKTAVAVSGQKPNASISSPCAFNGSTWLAHDVAVYGPGTYTVNPCCTATNPGCSTTCAAGDIDATPITPITFTVGAGEMGAHMLFNWSTTANIDVVDVWQHNLMFGPSPLFDGTAPGGCGSNLATTTWSWMSKDWGSCGKVVINDATGNEECTAVANGVLDAMNGAPMVDGPFNEQNANFNWQQPAVDLCAGVVCTALDQCHVAGVCDPATGLCSNPPAADNTACNDNNACTTVDTCQNGTCTGASPVVCTALDQCHVAGVCDPANGQCSNPAKTDGTACNDGLFCTATDTCQTGVCTGSGTPCTVGQTCDEANDMCITASCTPPANGCEDNNVCTQNNWDATVQGGTCPCLNTPVANGTSCADADLCNGAETCQSGACTAGTPVVCAALDQCHNAGTCDPATGACSNPNKTDGTACNDGLACTTNDVCTNGSCGGTAVVCTASDQCHVAGVCDISTGACSNPIKTDGTACNDNNACTTTDVCTNGTCGGTATVCTALDQCHDVGTCDSTTGVCSNPNKTDGTACNDGLFCTLTDTCQNGVCTGSGTPCTVGQACDEANDQCITPSCTPPAGNCNDNNPCTADSVDFNSNPGGVCACINAPLSGTSCSDGNACTSGDTCQNGVCQPGTATVCTALDQCHVAGVCDPASGVCSNPVATDGTSCNDNNLCTTNDVCTAGVCGGTPIPGCGVTGSDVGIVIFRVPSDVKDCRNVVPIQILTRNFGTTTVTGTIILYKDGVPVQTWSNVTFYPMSNVNEMYLYNPAGDAGKTINWEVVVDVPNDPDLSNNTSVGTTTVVPCGTVGHNKHNDGRQDG